MDAAHARQAEPAGARAERDETGASAVEYGLLIAGIAALIVASVFLFGGFISDSFQGSCDTIATQVGTDC